jgi:uncharacterized protein (TIGR03435 family)
MGFAIAWGILSLLAFGQSADPPQFVAADVHVAAKTPNQNQNRSVSTRGDRYEVKNATMVDLITMAYNSNPIKVLGGPSWLEMDRFDVIAKQPPQTLPDNQRLMLQALLKDRFKLMVREEMKPMPTYALIMGKKSQLKEADGSGDSGCKAQSTAVEGPGQPGEGTIRIAFSTGGGPPLQLSLANGLIEYRCRNMTMAAFVETMRGFLGANLGVNPVIEQTGLSGIWNFDLRYSLGLVGLPGVAQGETISISAAIDKQLGLKLEERQVPTAVVVVDSVNQKPSENPKGTAEALPPITAPTEFEVASVKPSSPDSRGGGFNFQTQAGGRFNSAGTPLQFLITRAFNNMTNDQLIGIPGWANTARFDVVAKALTDGPQAFIDANALAPMILALLKERFKLAYHTEERELPAYTLMAAKPKMRKADPSTRTWCKAPTQVPGAPPAPSGQNALICQNVTMTQFVELLRGRAPDLQSPISDSTGLEGSWDFTLTFNPRLAIAAAVALARPPEAGPGGNPSPTAAEPIAGLSIYEALEKQLGLKLEKTKRSMPVIVIDHLEQTPTDD